VKPRAWIQGGCLAIAVASLAGAAPQTVVVLETEVGVIAIEVDVERAPITSANFLRYIDAGLYAGGEFHRAVRPDNEVRADAPIQVVQARIDQARKDEGYGPIALERTRQTGLTHLDGTVSMARDVTPTAPGPDTATSGIFICIGDQPVLDFAGKRSPDGQGFAAFGRVVTGMDVVKKIQMSRIPRETPATNLAAAGQSLDPTIRILKAYRK
jgi:peptidyl-prolyl cis-trans isomerase A (cyclophilin A)